MSRCGRFPAAVFALALIGALPGCALYGECGLGECPADAQVSTGVRTLFDQYLDLQPPNLLYVQAHGHLVTLSGNVNTEYARRLAESVALEAPGVARVVNFIGVDNGAR